MILISFEGDIACEQMEMYAICANGPIPGRLIFFVFDDFRALEMHVPLAETSRMPTLLTLLADVDILPC